MRGRWCQCVCLKWGKNLSRYVHVTSGVFTPGKSASSLALVWTKYNVWCGSLSHYSFCKWARNCKQNHTCAKVMHSLVHSTITEFILNWTENTSSAGSRYGCLVSTRVRLDFCIHTPVQKIHTKGGNELELNSVEPNETGVNNCTLY